VNQTPFIGNSSCRRQTWKLTDWIACWWV